MYDGGEIIIVKSIQFDNMYADHASLKGRPCLILSDINEKLTLVPLSSSEASVNDYTLKIEESKIKVIDSRFKKRPISYVNLNYMFQRDLRYYEIEAYVRLKRYYELLLEIEEKRLEKNLKIADYYKEIYQDLEYQRNELKRELKI